MLVVFFKGTIIFIFVLFVMRLMGKRELGEMQPFELVITILIADVATIPINDPGVPIYFGLIPIVTLVLMHFAVSFLSRKSLKLRRFFSGSSVIVLDKNGINYRKLKSLNMGVQDLIEAVRSKDYHDLSQLEYVILETNGAVSVVAKATEDADDRVVLPLSLVIDGKAIDKNLDAAKITKAAICKKLSQLRLNIKHVLLADIRQDGSMYIQPKAGKYIEAKMAVGGEW